MRTLAKFVALIAFTAVPSAALAAWEPEKPVEFIVPAAAGSRLDQMARLIQNIAVRYQLMKHELVVVNLLRGAGAEGFLRLKKGETDPSTPTRSEGTVEPHRIMIAGTSIFTTPIATGVPFNWKDVSPIVNLALEPFILWTHSKSRYKSAAEYIEAAKAAGPGKLRMRGTGGKQDDQILTGALERATGAKFVYVPFKWALEPRDGWQPEKFDSALYKPIEGEALWRDDAMTPQCVFSNARLATTRKVTAMRAWKDIPTCKESGIAISYQAPSIIFMAPGVTDEQMEYFVALFKKIIGTQEWKAYMEKGAYSQTFVTGQKFKGCLAKMDEFYKQQPTGNCGFICKDYPRSRAGPVSLPSCLE